MRPRWGTLYATVFPQLAALGAVEVVQSPGAIRLALRCGLALGVFATMSVWLRANRSAFDLQDWCDCAGERMTIRVIESPLTKASFTQGLVEEEYEVAGR
jgi:hypothetical protein